MPGTDSKKMGIKEGIRAILVNAPEAARRAIDPPSLDVASELVGEFDYIHLFARTQAELDDVFPKLKAHLKPRGMLWVSWPKNKKMGTDLALPKVIEIGYNHGLVESKTLSVDDTWSAKKFTYPKKGKAYNNSYGQLPPPEPRACYGNDAVPTVCLTGRLHTDGSPVFTNYRRGILAPAVLLALIHLFPRETV